MEKDIDDIQRFGFVVIRTAQRPCTHGVLFLVDRSRFPKKWWTTKLSESMYWESEIGAERAASKLNFGQVNVRPRTQFHK